MDLKALLVEAKQKVPPVLQVLQMGDETMLDIGGTNDIIVSTQVNTVLDALQNCPGCVRFLCCDFIKVLNIFCSLLFFVLCFHIRRERMYVLWWFGSQDHRLSQVGGHADETGYQHWTQRLFGQQLNGFLKLCTSLFLPTVISLFCTKCIILETLFALISVKLFFDGCCYKMQ